MQMGMSSLEGLLKRFVPPIYPLPRGPLVDSVRGCFGGMFWTLVIWEDQYSIFHL